MTEKFLTAKQLAERSGYSTCTIYRLKDEGLLPFVQLGGKGHKILFKEDCLATAASNPSHTPKSPDHPSSLPGRKPTWMTDLS